MRVYLPTRDVCSLATEDDRLLANFQRYNRGQEGVEFVDAAREADVIVLFEQFSFKRWDYKDSLRDSWLREFSDRVFTINYDDHGRGHLPGCYTSLNTRTFDPLLHRACAYPRTYNEYAQAARPTGSSLDEPTPRLLFSFCGTLASHPVRKAMARELSGRADGVIEQVEQTFHQHTDVQKRAFIELALDSSFVLCPRGWSPSTYRLFEVMALGRCPVVISDEWVPIDGIAWEECSIRIRESRTSTILATLLERKRDAPRLGAYARRIWEESLSVENRNKQYLRSILDIHRTEATQLRTPWADRYAHWSSWRFYWANGWTLPQRARSKLARVLNKPARKS